MNTRKYSDYFTVVVFYCKLSAQSYTVKNVNDEYVIENLKGSEKYKNNIKEVIRDKNGLYWFQNLTDISSFDGINWKAYKFTNANGRNVPVRINEIEVTDDSTIWLATPEGMYGLNRRLEKFIPIKQMFPHIVGMPVITNCIYKGVNDFLFVSFIKQGFYILNWDKGNVRYVTIDTINNVFVPTDNAELDVTTDREGNYWGLTKEHLGIWSYNSTTGKMSCSWNGQVFPELAKRWQGRNITGITYSDKEDALLLSYGPEGILEKLYLSTGKTVFYSFSNDLQVRADTNMKNRYRITSVRVDKEKNEWLLVEGKYLVKLHYDITKFEYLKNDPDLLPLGKMKWLLAEQSAIKSEKQNDHSQLWISGDKGLSVVRKINASVKQIPFEKRSIEGITPHDYIDSTMPSQTGYLARGTDDNYLLLQQEPGRPKLLGFDKNFHVTKTILNNEWKQYPAYFNPQFTSHDFYIAILRPGNEPLDFRNVVLKDFKVDLRFFQAQEVKLSFAERVWRYGASDANSIYWLFSNGSLYSYDPKKNLLDSIFVCSPRAKRPYPNFRIKGYDFPTKLHKNSSTFWINFWADKELYKIDLKRKKVDKIFKSCLDQPNCLQSAVVQIYDFDSARIFLKLNFSGALLNPTNDSITFCSDLFTNKLPNEYYVGSFVYENWLCNATLSEIDFQDMHTGKQKRLLLNEDFKGTLSPLNSPPLVSKNGEMVIMSSDQKIFIVFNIDSIPAPAGPGRVRFSLVKLDEKELQLDSFLKIGSLRLKYNGYASIHFKFSDYSLIDQDKIKYEYALYNGGDTVWNKIEGEPELTFTKITPGNYKLLLRAGNGFGDYSSQVTTFSISIIPPFTQTMWFVVMIVVIVAGVLYVVYRYRLRQVKKLQTIRNNIAIDLHDDIGSTLNSISVYSEVAKQQAGKEIPALDLIGLNSRKIIESMSDIVWTINPENDSFEKVIARMRSFAHQLLKAKKIEYTFETDEKLNTISLPMQVRKNFYLVFKEAITNLIKYSGATKVSIALYENNKTILLRIRDNGIGIPLNAETQGNGLMNMNRRAKEIDAILSIESTNAGGTAIELILNT